MIHLIAILAYLFILLGIGLWRAKSVHTQEDFAVAGRSLGPWMLLGTMLATWIGTGSILGNAGEAYEKGFAVTILPFSSVLGIIVLTFIAGKVRDYNKYTVPEIIHARYGQFARVLAVIALTMAYMVIVSYQFSAGGLLIQEIFKDDLGQTGISIELATAMAAIFIILYTVVAGLYSVTYTDVGNGIVITVCLIIAFPVLLSMAGGFSGMEQAFAEQGKLNHMNFFGSYDWVDYINIMLPAFLLVMGDANMYQRFSASLNSKGARKAVIMLVFVVLVVEMLIVLEAWVASSLITDADNGKYVLLYAAKNLLPTALGVVMVMTIVGIIVSTADSFLLVPATTLICDIYLNYINPKADEKKILFLSRMLILLLGVVAYVVSLMFSEDASFLDKAFLAYTIYGTSITPALVAALFWKRASPAGAVASIISGTCITIAWGPVMEKLTGEDGSGPLITRFDAVLPSIACSLFFLIGVSLLTKPKPPTTPTTA